MDEEGGGATKFPKCRFVLFVQPGFFTVFLTQRCLPDFQYVPDYFVYYKWNNSSILNLLNFKL